LQHANFSPSGNLPTPVPLSETQIDYSPVVRVLGLKFKEGAAD